MNGPAESRGRGSGHAGTDRTPVRRRSGGTRPVRHEIEAPAKTNLLLRVLAREESGWHQIETVFLALELADRVVVELGPLEAPGSGRGEAVELDGVRIELDVTGVPTGTLGPADGNLAVRAAGAWLHAGGDPGFRTGTIRLLLDKRIPHGGGLGGGSSDAAAVLVALDSLADSPLGRDRLLELGAALGADVPFFVSGASLALAWGRGERLLRLPPLAAMPALLVVPPFRVSTPDAYTALAASRAPAGALERALGRNSKAFDLSAFNSWERIEELARNDFHDPVEQMHPRLGELRRRIRETGARIALLSGSGSTLIGIYRDEETRDHATSQLDNEAGIRTLKTRTRG